MKLDLDGAVCIAAGRWLVGVVCIAAGLSGCGDPREPFVGLYRGTGLFVVTLPDGSKQNDPLPSMEVQLTAPSDADRLVFANGDCGLVADVTGGETFEILPRACPAEKIDVSDSSAPGSHFCTRNQTVDAGGGRLSGDTLEMNYRGAANITGCTNGWADARATYTTTMTVTRL